MFFSNWNKKRRKALYGTYVENYNLIKKLRTEGKSNEQFETMLSALSLEEVIALKLDLSFKNIGFYMCNLPLWSNASEIMKDAMIKFAFSASSTTAEAARLLGISPKKFYSFIKKYEVKSYYKEPKE